MYSGTTLTKYSGLVMGAHQKFNRVSRRHLKTLLKSKNDFPSIRKINHFEGNNGPDGVKRKSPAQDEPWHYFDPFDSADTQLLDLITGHYKQLVKALKNGNDHVAEFEAAWLAHAIVDGLTPAHHYPYERELEELRGESISTRTSVKDKLVMPGKTRSEQIVKNWKMWGPRGLMTSHGMFEIGIATLIKPLTFSEAKPKKEHIEEFAKHGLKKSFIKAAREIAVKDMYHNYLEKGWTPKLAYDVRHTLGPVIVRTITLAWYQAVQDAKKS